MLSSLIFATPALLPGFYYTNALECIAVSVFSYFGVCVCVCVLIYSYSCEWTVSLCPGSRCGHQRYDT